MAKLRTVGFGVGMMALGMAIGAAAHASAEPSKPVDAPASYSRYAKLDMFARALALIEQYYVRPVDDQALVYAAVRGLVTELDPHTTFLPPFDAKLLREDMEGAFGGIGMVVVLARDDDGRRYLDIRDVIAQGPAARANIEPGHRILEIDGQPVAQFLNLQRAIRTIRGEPGSTIAITVEDPVRGVKRTVPLTRAIIDTPPVEVRYLDDGFGVLRLRDFPENAAQDVKAAIEQLRDQAKPAKLSGIVLDLRDNGGGLLDEAIRIVDLFIDEGAIVRTRGRRGVVLDEARAHRVGTLAAIPVVVLVNKGSASASEIVAGALQDHQRALIVGERTYGKGSVQAPFNLRDGSVLKLTTALYFTPADRLIQASGIMPDVFVGARSPDAQTDADSRPEIRPERAHPRHLRPEDFGRTAPGLSDEGAAERASGDDVQLRRAVQHLRAWARVSPKLSARMKRANR